MAQVDRILDLLDHALQRSTEYGSTWDTPTACWRCEALPAENDVGLCEPCTVDLRSEVPAVEIPAVRRRDLHGRFIFISGDEEPGDDVRVERFVSPTVTYEDGTGHWVDITEFVTEARIDYVVDEEPRRAWYAWYDDWLLLSPEHASRTITNTDV